MIRVLLLLQWLSLRGRVVRSFRLLRQPKYLVGLVIGPTRLLIPHVRAPLGHATRRRATHRCNRRNETKK